MINHYDKSLWCITMINHYNTSLMINDYDKSLMINDYDKSLI